MAISKKGFRKIVVDGHPFLWKVRKKISWNEIHDGSLDIPVQHVDGGQLMVLTIGYSRSYFTGNNEFSITPGMLAMCIREAIRNGWNYQSEGPAFRFDCSGWVADYLNRK